MNKKTGCKNNTDAITKEALDAQKEKKNRKIHITWTEPCHKLL